MRKEFFSKARNRITAVILAALLAVNVSASAGAAKVTAAGVSDSDAPAVVKTVDDDKTEESIEETAEAAAEITTEEPAEEAEEEFVDEAAAAEETAEEENEETEKEAAVSSADSGDASEAIDDILSGNIIGGAETISDSDFMPVPVIMSRSDMLLGATPAPDDIASGSFTGGTDWLIDKNGKLIIYPANGAESSELLNEGGGWSSYVSQVTSVYVEGKVKLIDFDTAANNQHSAKWMFNHMENCTEMDLRNLDISTITTFRSMFQGDTKLEKLNLSGWNPASATTFELMFYECESLKELDLSSFNTPKLQNTNQMFCFCESLTSLDMNSFDMSHVSYAISMFQYCSSLTEIKVDKWNTSNLQFMTYMFADCNKLEKLDVSNFNVKNVTNMDCLFEHDGKLGVIDVSKWETDSLTDMMNIFNGCGSVKELDLSNWNISKVDAFMCLFNSCSKLEKVDISTWDFSKIESLSQMFHNCTSLTSVDLTNFNTDSAIEMIYMFAGDTAIERYEVPACWKPAEDYVMDSEINSFNVVDGALKYQYYGDYRVKSVTIHDGGNDIEVDLKKNPTSWEGFTGDMTATIVFEKPVIVKFVDKKNSLSEYFYNRTVDEKYFFKNDVIKVDDPYKNGSTNPMFPASGYDFLGWSIKANDSTAIVDVTTYDITESITFYACYTVHYYTVTVVTNEGGTATPMTQKVQYMADGEPTVITPDEGYRIRRVVCKYQKSGSKGEMYRDMFKFNNGSYSINNYGISEDKIIEITFEKTDVDLIMKDTFKVTDDITFTAVGNWLDVQTYYDTYYEGDVKYVPDNWHHDFPKGDWGGIDDPKYSYTGKFNQPVGTYTIHVIFNKYVYKSGKWVFDGTKELTHDYIVKGDLLGGNDDIPKTGDDFNPVLWISIGSVCLIALIALGILMIKKRRSEN